MPALCHLQEQDKHKVRSDKGRGSQTLEEGTTKAAERATLEWNESNSFLTGFLT